MESTFRDRVAKRLEALGLESYEAARKGGLERTYIEDIIRGRKQSVRGSGLAALAMALNTTETWLLKGEGPEDMSDAAPQAALRVISRSQAVRVSASSMSEVFITSLDIDTGECRLQQPAVRGTTIAGVIVDPALALPGNAYGAAMAARRPLRILAKRVSDHTGERLVVLDAPQGPDW